MSKRNAIWKSLALLILAVVVLTFLTNADAPLDTPYEESMGPNTYEWPRTPEKLALLDSAPNVDDYFETAQYFFNARNESDGVYDLQLAREFYYKALEENPYVHSIAWYQFGRIDFLEGKYEAAIEKFKTQIKFFGNEASNVHYMLGLVYGYRARDTGSEEDWLLAEESFKTYIELEPGGWAPYVDLAWVLFAQGKFEEMIPVLEEALIRHSESPWVLNMYGLALMNTGRTEEAYEYFLRARESVSQLTPDDWGSAYPGNNPVSWSQGLSEFQETIERNILLFSE